MAGVYRERMDGRRRSENIVDLRPKTEEEREAMYRRLLAQGGNALDVQITGEHENKYWQTEADAIREREQKEREEELRQKMKEKGFDKVQYRQELQQLDMNSESGRQAYENLRLLRVLGMRNGI